MTVYAKDKACLFVIQLKKEGTIIWFKLTQQSQTITKYTQTLNKFIINHSPIVNLC